VYVPPALARPVKTEVERRVEISSYRVLQGLPVSDAVLDEILGDSGGEPNSMLTRAEQLDRNQSNELSVQAQEVLADADDVLGRVEMCWLDGRRAVRVRLTDQFDHYRDLLSERIGADRVSVEFTPQTKVQVTELQARLSADRDELAEHGIRLTRSGGGRNGLEISYLAWDQHAAEQILHQRYGTDVDLHYAGASTRTFRPFPFGSWLEEDDHLHVFYALHHNGERPGGCQAFEDDQSIVVALTINDSRGAKHLIGGFTPSHATVKLSRPVGHRVVIDDSANAVRPHWTEL
jgi:hypothetical protein